MRTRARLGRSPARALVHVGALVVAVTVTSVTAATAMTSGGGAGRALPGERLSALVARGTAPAPQADATTAGSPPVPGVAAAPGPAPQPRVDGNRLVDGSGTALRLLGVDVSGTEDACVLGAGMSWGPLDGTEAAAIAAWGVDAVRVPLNEDCWLGINRVAPGLSGAAYRQAIERWVADLNAAGLVAVLDLHWSAPGGIEALRQWPMADSDHSVTFWTQVATAFARDPSVVFDLFNEPYLGRTHPSAADWACWRDGCTGTFDVCGTGGAQSAGPAGCTPVRYQVAGMQQLLDAVRAAGARQPVMVGGLDWAGDPCGLRDRSARAGCAWLSWAPSDPANQLVAGFHTYDWTACTTPACWSTDVAPVAARVPVVTGELGERDCSTAYVARYTGWADQQGISYLAWSWQPAAPGAGCAVAGMRLVSDWSGTPSTAGAAFRAHVAAVVHGS